MVPKAQFPTNISVLVAGFWGLQCNNKSYTTPLPCSSTISWIIVPCGVLTQG
uniref:Uncharacterized protein n=1 Tax=Arundo donax TaxID=35708 RepID=A0A0A9GAU4_ARUDO